MISIHRFSLLGVAFSFSPFLLQIVFEIAKSTKVHMARREGELKNEIPDQFAMKIKS